MAQFKLPKVPDIAAAIEAHNEDNDAHGGLAGGGETPAGAQAKADAALEAAKTDATAKDNAVLAQVAATYATAAAANAKYTKPGSGIPESDLTSAVQAKLALAETAQQAGAAVTSVNGMTGDVTIGDGGESVGDATSSIKGVLRLTNHLGGTADAPTVPGLASKADTSAVTSGLAGKVDTTDVRLTDSRTPTAHASTHNVGGSDPITFPIPTAAGTTFTPAGGLVATNTQAAIVEVKSKVDTNTTNITATNSAIDTARVSAVNSAAADATAKVSAHDAANGAHGIYQGSAVPTGTQLSQWLPKAELLIGPNNKLWLRSQATADTPAQPTPVEATPAEQMILSQQAFVAEFVKADGSVVTNVSVENVTSDAAVKAIGQAVLEKDQSSYDKITDYVIKNLRRDVAGSGKTFLINLLGTRKLTVEGTVDWTVHAGANVRWMKHVLRAYNLWGRVSDRDLANKICSDLLGLVNVDESRAYLGADENQKLIVNGHHTYNSSQYWKNRLGDYDIAAFRMAFTFTGNATFQALISGAYDIFTKAIATSGAIPTSNGLLPNFCSYSTATHSIGAITNGADGWTETQSTEHGEDAWQAVANLVEDYKTYADARSKNVLIGAFKTFLGARWSADSKIFSRYNRDGTAATSIETNETYLRAVSVLNLDDSANATASAIRSAKIPATMATNAFGRYIPNQPAGATASSTRDGNLGAWFAKALDTGFVKDFGILGSNPNSGTISPPTGATGGTPPTEPPPVVVVPNPNPVEGVFSLYTDPYSQIMNWANGLPSGTKKTRALWAANLPQAYWSGINWDPVCDGAKTYIDGATAKGAVALVLAYSIPLRDLGQYSSGGAQDDLQYQEWIRKLALAIGVRKVALVYEPDSLTHADELTQTQRSGRMANMRWAINYLKTNCPNLWLYIDVGHPEWKSVADAVRLLLEVGVDKANGFAINVSNFVSLEKNIAYGQQVKAGLNMSHIRFTVDCSRNGNPTSPSHWANPPNRRIGRLPQMGNLGVEGLDLIAIWKRIGESDGASGDGSPGAGAFWPTYIFNDSVGDNVTTSLVSTSSGLIQRPPTPGVAVVPP